MSTTTTTTPSQTPAPWRAPFLSHLAHMQPTPTFTLATLHPATRAEAPSAAMSCLPRARTCVFRGLWACPLPGDDDTSSSPSTEEQEQNRGRSNTNNRNPAPRNPPLFESDLPVFTTDARTDKAEEIVDSASGSDIASSGGQTGGGGPVEAVFWVDAPGVKTQWRVRGHAVVLGADADADGEGEDGARRVRGLLRGRMRRRGGAGKEGGQGEAEGGEEEKGWSFAREVTAHFGNLSPLMRGSFRAPSPGTPVAYHPEKGESLGQRLDDLQDALARRHFRVVVIVPDEVDQVDLSDELRPRRWLYVYRGEVGESLLSGGEVIGEWEKVEVWP